MCTAALLACGLVLAACTTTPSPVPAPTSGSTATRTATPTPAAPSSGDPVEATVTHEIVFGNPWSKNSHRVNAVTESAIDLIDSTVAGQTLTLSMFNFTFPGTGDALARAHKRGVDVHVLLNSEIRRPEQLRIVQKALGHNTDARSWVVVRPGGLRMHAKFLLISPTDSEPPVVWVSSGNLTTASGAGQANEALTLRGDQPLYDFLAEQFELMRSGVTDPVRLGRVATTAATIVRSYPIPDGGAANDPVMTLLDDVTCVHNNERTVVRLGHLFLTIERLYVAQELRELKESGCDVRVVGHLSVWVDKAEKILVKPGAGQIDLRDSVGAALHTKITTIDGWDASGNRLQVAMVGTHNLTGRALAGNDEGVNDEISLTLRDPDVVRRYSDWVDTVIDKHSRAAVVGG
mgnify:FL=1